MGKVDSEIQGTYCQNCFTWNAGERETCRKCGHRLFIVTGDQSWDEDEPDDDAEDLDEHLLERITNLEESLHRVETYLEAVSDQLGRLERSEIMLRNGLMSLVQELEEKKALDGRAFSERWEDLVEENLQLIGAREMFTRYRARILPISKPKSAAQLRRALLETSAFLENAQLLEAAQRLAQAIALDPKNYELLFTVAALMETAQEYEAAENLAQRVVGLSPRHYEAWMLLAKLAQDEPDGVDRAVEALKQAVSLRPEEVEPRLQLCDLLMEKEDFQGAQEIAMEALHLQRDGETLSLLGEVLLAQGEHAKAIPLLKEASGFLPGDTLIRQHLAEGYLQAGERTKAFAILTELLRQHPGDPDLLLLLDAETPDQLRSARGGGATSRALLDEAEATFEDNHLPESLSLVRQAQQREKTQRGDWLQLQLAWATDPKNHVAQAMTFTASARHPRLCFHALRLLVDWHGERNDEAALFAALDAYLAVHPKSSGAWEAAVIRQAYRLMSGHATEADLEETRRLHVQPLPGQEARVRSLLGQYLLDFKRPNEVLDLLEPVMRNEPTLINHFQLGSALVALGEVEEALDVLNDGLHAPPGDLPEAQAQILQAKMQGLVDELKKSHHLG